jgi:NMD protein affecting ribosome stability and mRNA decay
MAGGPMCRSCGKRPGRPTAILGQMTQAELCAQCTALRKERIRLNRAAARGLRSSRLF